MATPLNVIERFENVTGFTVTDYLQSYVDFVEFDQPNIVAYYSGVVAKPKSSSFAELDRLLKQATIFNSSIRLNAARFESAEDWDFLERIEDVRVKLWSVDQASKWLRSAITRNSFNPNPEQDYSLMQNQTLENVSQDVEGSSDPQNDYIRIAIRNDLNEEKYTPDGGVLLKVNISSGGATIVINSVVDNLVGEKLYGLDLAQKFTFVDNDLQVLTYKETIIQAINILANLRQNDNPEFPTQGLRQNIIVGTNRNSLLFPVLFRQMANTFKQDDTLASFAITNISFESDVLRLEYQVQTKYGEIFKNSATI